MSTVASEAVSYEVAIPPAVLSIKLIYPAEEPLFLFSDLAALAAKSENK